MITYINTFKMNGMNAVPVTVETEIAPGIGIHLVGLADNAVKEALLRTVTALQSLGYHIPGKKVVINLAPADLRKSGEGYDLPIALGILSASGQKPLDDADKYIVAGEVALDGKLRDIPGWAQAADLAKATGRGLILPRGCALLAARAVGEDVTIYPCENISDAVAVLQGDTPTFTAYTEAQEEFKSKELDDYLTHWDDIKGHNAEKRALEIAAAGGHPVILVGAPGTGRSGLARVFSEILPPMTADEDMDVQRIYSAANKQTPPGRRPFRAPHSSASLSAVLGGGSGDNIVPGEVSLAHNGVLYLDEFAEVPKALAEGLRAPLEDGKIVISRLKSKTEYPAKFFPIFGTNPCPCGYYGEGDRCTCTPGQRAAYLAHLSGPVMDRITMQVWTHAVKEVEVSVPDRAEVASRVAKARVIQMKRQGCLNDETTATQIANLVCSNREDGEAISGFTENMMMRMNMSARAYIRILKIARTIADLEGYPTVMPSHLAEAASYRFLDRREI